MPLSRLLALWPRKSSGPVTVAESPSTSRVLPWGAKSVSRSESYFGLNFAGGYEQQVSESRALAEQSPLVKMALIRIVKAVSQPVTHIEVPVVGISAGRAKKVTKIFNALMERIEWESRKEAITKNFLIEGGASWEVIVPTRETSSVRYIEVLPHDTIRPILNAEGLFIDPAKAYRQIAYGAIGQREFARWQIVDWNLEEAFGHNRGVPYFGATGVLVRNISTMLRGLVQKWVRAGGAIEHYNLADATRWGSVEAFKQENKIALEESPDALVRQVFTMGKASVERVEGDKSSSLDVAVIHSLVNLFLSSVGTPAAVYGLSDKAVTKDDVIWETYQGSLASVEKALFKGLYQLFDFELLLAGIPPETVPYTLVGGSFEPRSKIKVQPETQSFGALTPNEVRRAAGADEDPDPMFDIPGIVITPEMAQQIAVHRGQAPEWMVKEVDRLTRQREDMATLAAKAAVAAAEGTSDPEKAVTTGKRPESAIKAPANKAPKTAFQKPGV